MEFSSHQVGDRTRESLERIIPLIAGKGKRPSVPPGKAVTATRDERSIRVNDFSGPTDSIADRGRIRVFIPPAPDVEPAERPPEILPLLGRRLYLLALRFRFLGARLSRLPVRVDQAPLL